MGRCPSPGGNLGTELDHAFAPNGTVAKHGSNTPSPPPPPPLHTHTEKDLLLPNYPSVKQTGLIK